MSNRPDNEPDPIPSELAQEDESFVDLVEEFVDGLGDRLAQIVAAVDDQDFAQLKTLAHQLKGSAGGYGYPIITQKAAEMEIHALGQAVEDVQADVKDLEQLVARVVVRM